MWLCFQGSNFWPPNCTNLNNTLEPCGGVLIYFNLEKSAMMNKMYFTVDHQRIIQKVSILLLSVDTGALFSVHVINWKCTYGDKIIHQNWAEIEHRSIFGKSNSAKALHHRSTHGDLWPLKCPIFYLAKLEAFLSFLRGTEHTLCTSVHRPAALNQTNS